MMRIAFHGELGAYGEEAARGYGGPSVEPWPCRGFEAVAQAVLGGAAELGVLPVENSHAGVVADGLDAILFNRSLHLVGEYDLRVRHCLLALPGAALERLTHAHSHPQALAQTAEFLKQHRLRPVAEEDTAGSARWLKERGQPTDAAVASRAAAERYGLSVVAEGIETDRSNTTRFWVVGRGPLPRREGSPMKTVVLLTLAPGALATLARLLGTLADAQARLGGLRSRPTRARAWERAFVLDLHGGVDEPPLASALERARASAPSLEVLGCFPEGPAQTGPAAAASARTSS